jgi:hypothetical protein
LQEALLDNRSRTYELESLLFEIDDKGYVIIHISKLWRLLEKGSRAAGTWKELLDAWEEHGGGRKRSDLHMFESNHEYLVISKVKTNSVMKLAGEA